ncbi:MAG: class I SAM-dependent methyltransferase [Burkholderiales bacterium]|nr:class I SAM-dependent methyltransferase [Burkholderiales bacterium]
MPSLKRLWSGAMVAMLLTGATVTAVGAAELSVPYVSTPLDVVDAMLKMAKVSSTDYLIDLGSGDGRIVVNAAKKYGARGFGVDLNPVRIDEANANARKAGVTDKVAFYQRDLFETDLSEASVITMYLLPRVNLELRPKLLALKPGTRIVSHDFSMDDWKPDTHVKIDVKDKYGASGGVSDVYFWVIPAKVAATWQWQLPVSGKPRSYEMTLTQKYQVFSGDVRIGSQAIRLQNPVLRGEQIAFVFTADIDGIPVKHEFTGRVEGDAISGQVMLSGRNIQGQVDWSAKRAAAKTAAADRNVVVLR